MATGKEEDVVDVLIEQHDQVKRLFRELAAAKGERKEDLFEDLVRLLAVHETAEEEIVHPIARTKIPNGEKVVENRLREEDEAKHGLAELRDLRVDSPEFDGKLSRLAEDVIEHATREEKEEFRYLRETIPADQRQWMASAVKAAEATAPTRPHPKVGASAVANMLAGPPMAVFDRIQDQVRDWRKSHAKV